MNSKKALLALGVAALLALTLAAGGWFVYTAYAQGATPTPTPANGYGGWYNNQAVFDLLKTNAADLQAQRQAGKSLLDIAQAQGVSEQALTDALMQPIESMHSWMGQNYPGFNDDQMDQYMRAQIAQDIRQTQYGTMTDFRLFSGPGEMMGGWNGARPGGMMGGWNGAYGGATNGSNGAWPGGMMGGRNSARPGGMMGGRTY